MSNVVVQELIEWMKQSKLKFKPIDEDVKDAKRRVNAAKGPRKRQKVPVAEDASDIEGIDSPADPA